MVAAAPGTVEKLFFTQGGGGITAYVRSADGRWIYYYAHLSAYAPGLHEGQRVRRGAPVGWVGNTGNANPAGPHLHFAINRMSRARNGTRGRRSIPIRCLPESPRAARARASSSGPRRRLFFTFSISADHHEDQRRGHSSRQHHRI